VEWRREFTQAGCELIGANSSASDIEVLLIACEILQRLDLSGNFLITLNDEGVFDGIASELKLDAQTRDEMRQLVDSRNATDLEDFLSSRKPAPIESRELALLTQLSGKRETLEQARQLLANSRSIDAVDRLEKLWAVIESLDLTDRFDIDFGDVARLDYYTGLTFNVYVNGAAVRVGSGGRYDGLTAAFGTAEPAVGFVLDLDALTSVLLSRRTDSIKSEKFQIARSVVNPETALLFEEARKRRANGDRVLIES